VPQLRKVEFDRGRAERNREMRSLLRPDADPAEPDSRRRHAAGDVPRTRRRVPALSLTGGFVDSLIR